MPVPGNTPRYFCYCTNIEVPHLAIYSRFYSTVYSHNEAGRPNSSVIFPYEKSYQHTQIKVLKQLILIFKNKSNIDYYFKNVIQVEKLVGNNDTSESKAFLLFIIAEINHCKFLVASLHKVDHHNNKEYCLI